MAVGDLGLGAAESGEVDDVVKRQIFAIRRLREVSIDEIGMREALVRTQGDVGACEFPIISTPRGPVGGLGGGERSLRVNEASCCITCAMGDSAGRSKLTQGDQERDYQHLEH